MLSLPRSLDLPLPILLIAIAELLIYAGHMQAAVAVHAGNLIFLALSNAYIEDRTYQALMLLPLFRLLNIAMPVFFNLTLYTYAMIYAPMYISMFLLLRSRTFKSAELGLSSENLKLYLPLGAAVGLLLGWGEYQVLRPEMLIPDAGWRMMLELSLIMVFFVGLVEEFVFRSVLQTSLESSLGRYKSLFLASALFALMHSGYHMFSEILFVFVAGLVFGALFLWFRNLPMITLAHGVTNISLFAITPLNPGFGLPALYVLLILITGGVTMKLISASKQGTAG